MIRLLAPYQFYKTNQIVPFAPDWERYLVLAGAATYDLTGGIPYVAPVAPRRLVPASLVVGATGAVLGIEGPGGTLIAVGSSNITAPGAPTGLTLTAAAGAVVAAFALPSNTGGSPLTAVTVTLSNGQSGSGLTSPITIATPAGTAVTATAKAANDFFESVASAASNSVTPTGATTPVVATALTLIGPTPATATVGTASGAFTVSLSPTGGTVASPVTVTPTAVTGVTFSPASVTLSTASPSATFTATASTAGTKAIAVTSTGGLTAPAAINLVVSAAAGAVLRNIATGMFYPDAALSNLTWAGSRTPFYNRSGATLTQAAILDGNKYASFNNVETSGPAGDTIKEYAIEYPEGTYTRITSGGANTMTLPQGTAKKQTDLCTLAVAIPPDAKAWVRMYSTGPAGHCVVFSHYSSDGTAQGQAGTSGPLNYVVGGGEWTVQPSGAANQVHAGPLAVIGMTARDSYVIYGDSESVGTNDIVPAGVPLQGHFDRSIGLTNPTLHVGVFGTRLATFIGNQTDRVAIAGACCNAAAGLYGINDATGTTDTAAQIVTKANTVAGYFTALGMKVAVSTLNPVTTSTDNWATTTNQTVTATNQKRIDVNTSLLTGGAPNITKVWDTSAALETVGYPSESGIWKAGYTSDGTHLGPAAQAAAAGAIVAQGLG